MSILIVLIGTGYSACASRAGAIQRAPTSIEPAATQTQQGPTPSPSSPARPAPEYNRLLEKAASQETILVVVQLALPTGPFVPEGELTEAKLQEQRAALSATREALIESLAGMNVMVYSEWDSVPAVGLKVDAEALRRLIASPLVLSIQEDSLSSTP